MAPPQERTNILTTFRMKIKIAANDCKQSVQTCKINTSCMGPHGCRFLACKPRNCNFRILLLKLFGSSATSAFSLGLSQWPQLNCSLAVSLIPEVGDGLTELPVPFHKQDCRIAGSSLCLLKKHSIICEQ